MLTKNSQITKTKIVGLPLVFVFILGALIVAAVFFGVKAASLGGQLAKLEAKENDIALANQEIKKNLALYSSYTEVSKQAEKLGMEKPEKFVYLTSEGVALR